MDTYHRELLQTYWLELLLATCEQLPSQKQVTTSEFIIRTAAESWFNVPVNFKALGNQKQEGSKD
jgi:hypothetical protein